MSLNYFEIPIGASRFSYGEFLVDDDAKDALFDMASGVSANLWGNEIKDLFGNLTFLPVYPIKAIPLATSSDNSDVFLWRVIVTDFRGIIQNIHPGTANEYNLLGNDRTTVVNAATKTWQDLVIDLYTILGFSGDSTLPYTPYGQPQNLFTQTDRASVVLDKILKEIGCVLFFDPFKETVLIKRQGQQEELYNPNIDLTNKLLFGNHEYTIKNDARIPSGVNVYFPIYNQYNSNEATSGDRWHIVSKTPADLGITVTTKTAVKNIFVGYQYALYDDTFAITNAALCNNIASQVADGFYALFFKAEVNGNSLTFNADVPTTQKFPQRWEYIGIDIRLMPTYEIRRTRYDFQKYTTLIKMLDTEPFDPSFEEDINKIVLDFGTNLMQVNPSELGRFFDNIKDNRDLVKCVGFGGGLSILGAVSVTSIVADKPQVAVPVVDAEEMPIGIVVAIDSHLSFWVQFGGAVRILAPAGAPAVGDYLRTQGGSGVLTKATAGEYARFIYMGNDGTNYWAQFITKHADKSIISDESDGGAYLVAADGLITISANAGAQALVDFLGIGIEFDDFVAKGNFVKAILSCNGKEYLQIAKANALAPNMGEWGLDDTAGAEAFVLRISKAGDIPPDDHSYYIKMVGDRA